MRVVQTLSFAALWGALAVVPAAPAATLTYTDRATWNGAVTNRTDVNFDLLTANPVTSLAIGSAPDQATVAGIGLVWFAPASGYGPAGTGQYLWNDAAATGTLGFSVTNALSIVAAFGVDLWTLNNPGKSIDVRVYDVGNPTPTVYTVLTAYDQGQPSNHPAVFFGYTSDTAVSKVEFVTTGPHDGASSVGQVALDNYSWGQLNAADPPPSGGDSETPEATTIGYLTIGMAAMVFGKRKLARAE
ncbi:MAG: hypothetical protein IT165_06925 [Bryobacterales bacterium]|nr:hypothetical protein [Bryobacterales bacterium]